MWRFDINTENCSVVYVVEKKRNLEDLHLRSHQEEVHHPSSSWWSSGKLGA